MVGGKVAQIHENKERQLTWINTAGLGAEHGDYCAIYVEGINLGIALEDKLWWQMGTAHWTPKGSEVTTYLKKIGGSGVSHPLGKDFELRYDMSKIAEQRRDKMRNAYALLECILVPYTPNESGDYDPMTQPAAYHATLAMRELVGKKGV